MFDLIIRNGFVVDPESGFAGKSDVAVEDGRIAEVSESISSKGTEELVEDPPVEGVQQFRLRQT